MQEFFHPESVAVVGVSASPSNLASRILWNLKNAAYKGKVWGVGPRDEELHGFPVFQSVGELPEAPDLAVLLVPVRNIPEVVEACGEKGIRRLVIESAGFAEFEGNGSEAQRKVSEHLKTYNMRMIGPNCLGVMTQANGFSTPFARLRQWPKKGELSLFSQSGGVGLSLLVNLMQQNVGLSKFCSYGNALDIKETDILDYYADDPDTQMIGGYLEGLSRGRAFVERASRCDKPVVAIKSNMYESTRRIAGSHSASMTDDDRIVEAAFRQAGILRVYQEKEMVQALAQLTLPPMRGRNLAVISRSGGHAVMAADQAAQFGFELPPFGEGFFERLGHYFKNSVIKLQNPLDYGQIYYTPYIAGILEECLRLDHIDGAVLIHVYRSEDEFELAHQLLGRLRPMMEQYGKPISVVLHTLPTERLNVMHMFDLPMYDSNFEGIRALANARQAEELVAHRTPLPPAEAELSPKARQAVEALFAQDSVPTVDRCLDLVEALDLSVPRHTTAQASRDLTRAMEDTGEPVALKLIHQDFSHKSEKGGVMLDVTAETILERWEDLQQVAQDQGLATEDAPLPVLVQSMAERGIEFIVGGKRDPNFGPVVLCGLGGVHTELYEDFALRLAPVDESQASAMLDEFHLGKRLGGGEGLPVADKTELSRIIAAVSRLLCAVPEIAEIDLNPVIVYPEGKGAVVVDSRIFKG